MKIWRANCECGERLVSDISHEHLMLVAMEHAAWHTRTKRQRTPVIKFLASREIAGASGSYRGPLASAA